MKFLCSEKISQHKFKTPEGYLVCVDSVLARTGKQTYKRSEIFGCDCNDSDAEVEVDRPAEEVFSDKTLASFENKPLTIEHPDEDVNISNHRDLAVGFARDIKRGKDNGQDVMLGTLVFTDEDAIRAIEDGDMVELSCGYDADIVDEENPCQRNIRGNHIALCQRGRAGNARIVDSKVRDDYRQGQLVKYKGMTAKVVKKLSEDEKKRLSYKLNPDAGDYYEIEIESRFGKDRQVVWANRLSDSIRDDALQKGKTYVAKSGATLKVVDYECSFSDYNGEATVVITYDYVSASGKKSGRAKANSHDFWKMLIDKSLTGDSVKDAMPKVYQCSGYAIVPEQAFTQYGKYAYIEARADSLEEAKQMRANFTRQWSSVNFIIVNCKTMKIEDSKIKDGKLVEVPYDTIGAFEGKLKGANINIDGKGKTWSGRIHYQLSYDASKASFNTFIKELERLESWLESIDIPVTFSANTDGKRHTAGFDIDKKWVRDSVQDYDEDDDDDLSNAEKELCDYMLKNVYEKGMTAEQLLRKMESYYSMYQRLARHKPEDIKEYFREEIRYGKYDSLKDVDTYEEATNDLKEQAKKEMKDYSDYENIEFESSNKNLTTNDVVTKYASLHGVSVKMNGSKPQLNFGGDWYEAERMRVANIGDGAAYFVRMKRVNDSMRDSKEDILQKIRNTQIREGDTFEMRDGQYLVQIQNVGKQEMSTRSGPFKTNGKNESLRLSVKLSSHAWGRIWKNGTIVFNETDALNVVRDKMIQFLKTVRDSAEDDKLRQIAHKYGFQFIDPKKAGIKAYFRKSTLMYQEFEKVKHELSSMGYNVDIDGFNQKLIIR